MPIFHLGSANEASLQPHPQCPALVEGVGQVGEVEEEGEVGMQAYCLLENAVPVGQVEGVELGG